MKLHLGCGQEYKKGWLNVDSNKSLKADLHYDLNFGHWPFKDNSVDEIYACAALEHMADVGHFMHECYRILRRGGVLVIDRYPHFSSSSFFEDFGHIAIPASFKAFHYFWKNTDLWGCGPFRSGTVRIMFGKSFAVWNRLVEPLVNLKAPLMQKVYEGTFLRNLFPAEYLLVKLVK